MIFVDGHQKGTRIPSYTSFCVLFGGEGCRRILKPPRSSRLVAPHIFDRPGAQPLFPSFSPFSTPLLRIISLSTHEKAERGTKSKEMSSRCRSAFHNNVAVTSAMPLTPAFAYLACWLNPRLIFLPISLLVHSAWNPRATQEGAAQVARILP